MAIFLNPNVAARLHPFHNGFVQKPSSSNRFIIFVSKCENGYRVLVVEFVELLRSLAGRA